MAERRVVLVGGGPLRLRLLLGNPTPPLAHLASRSTCTTLRPFLCHTRTISPGGGPAPSLHLSVSPRPFRYAHGELYTPPPLCCPTNPAPSRGYDWLSVVCYFGPGAKLVQVLNSEPADSERNKRRIRAHLITVGLPVFYHDYIGNRTGYI